jgi:branched-chain amino acid transport system permease protein
VSALAGKRRSAAAARVRPAALAALAVFAIALVLPFGVNEFWLSTAAFVLIAAIGALGLGVLTGYTGQISLGHAFFLAVGAYTAAVLGGNDHLTAAIWLPAAGVIAGLCGALAGPMALRLRGLYLAIVTIALVFIGQYVWSNASAISGGPGGRAFPPVQFGSFNFAPGQQLTIGGLVIDHNGLYYYLSLFLLALAMLYVFNLQRSRAGRAMRAVREREVPASIMGINLARTKVSAFVISSFMAGISGALYGSLLSFATPDAWSLLLSIQYIAAIILGGMGTVWGPLLGSIVIFALPALLQSAFPQTASSGVPVTDITSIFYGVLIIACFVAEPRGLIGLGARAWALARRGGARRAPRQLPGRPQGGPAAGQQQPTTKGEEAV